MITFDFVKKLHALVAKFPERREEYKILYPDAFEKENVTEKIHSRIYGYGFFNFRLYDGKHCIAEAKPYIEEVLIFKGPDKKPEKRTIESIRFAVELGYEVEIRPAGSYGFKIFRYGKNAVNLEFRPEVEANRIKESD